MSRVLITEELLTGIAQSIREKLKTQATYKPSDMADAIRGMSLGQSYTSIAHVVRNGDASVSHGTPVIKLFELLDWHTTASKRE